MGRDFSATTIQGVYRRDLLNHPDERGSFAELWRDSWTAGLAAPFVQANLSRSRAGVLRGLHFHRRQTDVWVVLDGRAHVALVDLRPALSNAGDDRPHYVTEVLGEGQSVLIPPGVAHGFWALTDVSLLYLVTNEYDGTDEHGFAWNDPSAAISWPPGEPLLSARDVAAPSLAQAVSAARQSEHSSRA